QRKSLAAKVLGLPNAENRLWSWPASFSGIPEYSTHACASNRAPSFRPPIRRSASNPRRRNSHQSPKERSRQVGWIPRCRAALPAIRAKWTGSADATRFSSPICEALTVRDVSLESRIFQRRYPATRSPTREPRITAAAWSAAILSRRLNFQNLFHVPIDSSNHAIGYR